MKPLALPRWCIAALVGGLLFLALPSLVSAHCDTMNGPVVTAARRALETGNVDLVLIWVQKKDEAVIREAFQKTLAVRNLSVESKTLADMYFFETLVRIHRAGEGVPYTGLKPAETEIDSGIAAADESLESGSPGALLAHLDGAVQEGISRRFAEVVGRKNVDPGDVEAGREYVRAYVEFIHFVERLYQAASGSPDGHIHGREESEHQ